MSVETRAAFLSSSVRRRGFCVALALAWFLALVAQDVSAQSRAITLAWDPNPESFVTGYIVYVGHSSGATSETYDVGARTSFQYTGGLPGVAYYFSVAAYADGPIIGPRSTEVSSFGAAGPTAPVFDPGASFGLPSPWGNPWGTLSARTGSRAPASTAGVAVRSAVMVCAAAADDCYAVDDVGSPETLGTVTALAAAADGRVFIVDGARSVRVASAGRLSSAAALVDVSADALGDVVVDPTSRRARVAYLEERSTDRDGAPVASIVRYRDVGDQLGERAVIVPDLAIAAEGHAPFAVDDEGRIYVARPVSADGEREGTILRFNSDGTVPADNPGMSPVFARGLAVPHALTWDAAARRLWLVGTNGGTAVVATSVAVDVDPRRVSADAAPTRLGITVNPASNAVMRMAIARTGDYVLAAGATLYRLGASGAGLAVRQIYGLDRYGVISAFTAAADGTLYVGISAGAASDRSSRVLMLRRP